MRTTLLANPHSDTTNPSASAIIVADTRLKVLKSFNADPNHFDVVFTANATAAIKLVMDCFAGLDHGFDYCYHRNSHTSLVGVREVAARSRCLESDEDTEKWLDEGPEAMEVTSAERPALFAYPAQSNMNGQRLPLEWSHRMRNSGHHQNTYSLLDAAAFVSTSPLNLADHVSAPDFTALSFYKIFGFPDLGALIVRKASSHILKHRRYFGGGTTDMATCFGDKPWVARKEDSTHARLEDGTIAIRSILALRCAINNHQQVFGGMDNISKHTSWLAKRLYDRLSTLTHSNGAPVCHIYKASTSTYGDSKTQGATVTLNVNKGDGSWMGPYAVGAMLRTHAIHVRTGSLCNPAGMACALQLNAVDMETAFKEGYRCNQHEDVREGGVLFGMVRITLGAMSTLEDVDKIADVFESVLVDRENRAPSTSTVDEIESKMREREKSIETPARNEPIAGSIGSLGRIKRMWKTIAGCLAIGPHKIRL
jgi:molybdenum cofactor sulfurtransferase